MDECTHGTVGHQAGSLTLIERIGASLSIHIIRKTRVRALAGPSYNFSWQF